MYSECKQLYDLLWPGLTTGWISFPGFWCIFMGFIACNLAIFWYIILSSESKIRKIWGRPQKPYIGHIFRVFENLYLTFENILTILWHIHSVLYQKSIYGSDIIKSWHFPKTYRLEIVNFHSKIVDFDTKWEFGAILTRSWLSKAHFFHGNLNF